ncbi:MAG: hypothetical protein DMD72_02985 [Gemmatimonadetes bacterium]|nr:MAG: hypothetical protein DMD72_02985 [Gemmatimonadota bacterium]
MSQQLVQRRAFGSRPNGCPNKAEHVPGCLRSAAQRFYESVIGFSFPMLFSGFADVFKWFEEADERFHIEAKVRKRVWRSLFGYRESFDV